MKRFYGLLLHEYLLLKPFVIAAVIINSICVAALPVAALILKYVMKVEEYNEAMSLVILPVMFPAIFGMLLTMCAVLRYENSIPKRNRFVFSLPVSKRDVVLSRAFIPSALYFIGNALVLISAEIYWRILGFDRPPDIAAVSSIIVALFTVAFSCLVVLMFVSAKELVVLVIGFVSFMLLLGNIIKLFDGVFAELDQNITLTAINNSFVALCVACVCLYAISLFIAYLLAGRRNKLCEG